MTIAYLLGRSHKDSLRFYGLILLFLSFFFGALFAPTSVLAQEEDYEEWLEQQRQDYEEYLSEQDKAFLKFLDQEWKDVQVRPRSTSPIDDKPEEAPRVEGSPEETVPSSTPPGRPSEPDDAPVQEDPGDEVEEEGASFDQSESSSPQDRDAFPAEDLSATSSEPPDQTDPAARTADGPSVESAELSQNVEVSFFGAAATVPYGSALVPHLQGRPDQSSIQAYWKTMAEAPHRPTLEVLQKQKRRMALSDWGYYVYLRRLSAQLYGDASGASLSNDAALWTWFMLMKSGYAVRVGYQNENVFLMLPVEAKIFDRPQMQLDGQRYYLMGTEVGGESLRTYEGNHPEADRVLRLDERTVPDVSGASDSRSVAFTFQGERLEMDVAFNPSVVEYLAAYPNVELQVLLRSGVSSVAQASLEDALAPRVDELSPRAAVNLLLKFAQFSTQYKRDRDHFGEERFLFPEETLSSGYSDCEDRAVLLAYLVRTLLDRKVVGLKWPRHVALAVRAGEGLEVQDSDRQVTVNGDPYIFADPTYIGSTLGMEMPLVEGTAPEIIEF